MGKGKRSCLFWLVIAAIAAVTPAPPSYAAAAADAAIAVTCTNPVGGASWRIVIDERNATVDGYPARIGESSISWFDTKDGGHYTLDRASGDLAASVASSTGGYSRRAHCDLGKPR